MAAEKLRDLSQPMDVALLDATVAAFYGTGSKEEVWSISILLLVRSLWDYVGIKLSLSVWLATGKFDEFLETDALNITIVCSFSLLSVCWLSVCLVQFKLGANQCKLSNGDTMLSCHYAIT